MEIELSLENQCSNFTVVFFSRCCSAPPIADFEHKTP